MNHWKVILATMVIFAAGVVTGGLLVRQTFSTVEARPSAASLPASPAPALSPPQFQRLEFLLRARRELDLTAEQQARIERIIRDGQERSRKLWESVAPDMRKELQAVLDKIRAELTPPQLLHFERLLRQSRRPPPEVRPPPERMRERFRPDEPFGGQPPRPFRRDPPPAVSPAETPANGK